MLLGPAVMRRARARPWRRCRTGRRRGCGRRCRRARAAASGRRRRRRGGAPRPWPPSPRSAVIASSASPAKSPTCPAPAASTPASAAAAAQRADHAAVLDHVGEGLARLDLAGEGQEDRPHGIAGAAVGDRSSRGSAGRSAAIASQTPSALEHAPAGRGDGRGAAVAGRGAGRRRIATVTDSLRPQALPQRQRQRQADVAAAGDEDVDARRRGLRSLRVDRQSLALEPIRPGPRLRRARGLRACSAAMRSQCSGRARNRGRDACPTPSRTARYLDLEPLEDNLFRGRSPQVGWQRVFGGQVIGQALVAACRTVEGRLPIRCTPISCGPAIRRCRSSTRSTRIRDGRSFTTRRVNAIQHGQADLLHLALVPGRGGGLRPPDGDAGGAAAGGPAERGGHQAAGAADAARAGARATASASGRSSSGRSTSAAISASGRPRPRPASGSRITGRCRTIRRSTAACSPTPPT